MENNKENAKDFVERINKLRETSDAVTEKITKYNFEQLIDDNYQAVKARGLITKQTDFHDFMEKLDEETHELATAYIDHDGTVDAGELIDCICVLMNMAKHYRIDIIQGLKNNAVKNWERAKHIDIKEL